MKENISFKMLDVSRTGIKDLFCFPLALMITTHPSLNELDLSNNLVKIFPLIFFLREKKIK